MCRLKGFSVFQAHFCDSSDLLLSYERSGEEVGLAQVNNPVT